MRPLVLNYPVTFVPGLARCSSALCLLILVFSEDSEIWNSVTEHCCYLINSTSSFLNLDCDTVCHLLLYVDVLLSTFTSATSQATALLFTHSLVLYPFLLLINLLNSVASYNLMASIVLFLSSKTPLDCSTSPFNNMIFLEASAAPSSFLVIDFFISDISSFNLLNSLSLIFISFLKPSTNTLCFVCNSSISFPDTSLHSFIAS